MLAVGDPSPDAYGFSLRAPGPDVPNVMPNPIAFPKTLNSLVDLFIWNKLLFDPRSLPMNRFYLGDGSGTLGPNYLDPTPMERRRSGWYTGSYKCVAR